MQCYCRYVSSSDGRLQERLVAVVQCESTTGDGFVKYVVNVLKKLNLNLEDCIGSSTDGASNMRGDYLGFKTLLKAALKDEKLLHVWCYAHVLNLVIKDVSSVVVDAKLLFNLLNSTFTFMRDSYKRIDVWRKRVPNLGLTLVGDTRWWAKAEALKKIFGVSNSTNSGFLLELILSLNEIASNRDKYNAETRGKAQTYLDDFLKFKTILTAQIFLRIFEKTTSLSEYLQTEGADILKAYNMVQSTIKDIQSELNEFEPIFQSSKLYVDKINERLEDAEVDFEVEAQLPKLRQRKKKKLVDLLVGKN